MFGVLFIGQRQAGVGSDETRGLRQACASVGSCQRRELEEGSELLDSCTRIFNIFLTN